MGVTGTAFTAAVQKVINDGNTPFDHFRLHFYLHFNLFACTSRYNTAIKKQFMLILTFLLQVETKAFKQARNHLMIVIFSDADAFYHFDSKICRRETQSARTRVTTIARPAQ